MRACIRSEKPVGRTTRTDEQDVYENKDGVMFEIVYSALHIAWTTMRSPL